MMIKSWRESSIYITNMILYIIYYILFSLLNDALAVLNLSSVKLN